MAESGQISQISEQEIDSDSKTEKGVEGAVDGSGGAIGACCEGLGSK